VIDWPVIYTDRSGGEHKMKPYQVIMSSDFPSPIVTANGVGFCAVSRVLRQAQFMRDLGIRDRERSSGMVDLVLIIGALLDTSAAENQIAAANKKLRIKVSTGAWATNDIPTLTFVQNSLECGASAYRGGTVLFGATDIKAVVTADGTYNLRSVQTTREDAVIATGDTLELLDVSAVIRVWFN